jgi:hypothetical protein
MVTVSFDPGSILTGLLWILAVVVVFFILRTIWRFLRRIFSRTQLHGMDRKGIASRWSQIETMAKDGNPMQLKMAVMEADKLLDHALKAMAMSGDTLGERLKFAAYKYPKIGEAWWAHRLRNQIVHESSFYLEPSMAKKAIGQYEKTLRMLNLL